MSDTLKKLGELAKENSVIPGNSKPQSGSSSSALTRLVGGGMTPKSSGGIEALNRVRSMGMATGASRVDDLAAAGRRVREEADAKEMFHTELTRISGNFSLRLATVLDYTASTTGDVQNFVANVQLLVNRFKSEFPRGVQLFPIAVRGGGNFLSVPDVVVGRVNNLEFYAGVENVGYTEDSPLGFGVTRAAKESFFSPGENMIQGIVTIGDNRFEEGGGYRDAIVRLQANDVALASLLTNAGYIDSHKNSVIDTMGEDGIVVIRDGSETSAIEMIAAFILNRRDNIANVLAAHIVAQRSTSGATAVNAQAQRLSLADFLRQKGKSSDAQRVLQGSSRKRIGNS